MNNPSDRTTEERIASDIVSEFLSILEPWFQPDKIWDKVESLANEFLYESILRELDDYHKSLRAEN